MQPPHLPLDDAFTLSLSLRTRWSDEDNQGVLNNAVYLTLLEEARHGYFSRLGLLEANRFPFVLLQTNIRFVAPGVGGTDVRVELATTHLGRSSFRQAYRVKSEETGEVWCEAEALLVAWDPKTRAGRPMEEHFRRALLEFEPQLIE